MQALWSGLPEWLPLPAGRLIPAIIQDAASGMVLMLVDLNQAALSLIAATGRVTTTTRRKKVVAKARPWGTSRKWWTYACLAGGRTDLKMRPAGGACELGYAPAFSGI